MKIEGNVGNVDAMASVRNNLSNNSGTDAAKSNANKSVVVERHKVDNAKAEKQKINITEDDYSGENQNHKNDVEATVEKMNERLTGIGRKLEYSVHEETNEVMIKVINTDDESVIREIPSEKLLDMAARMYEVAGLFVDEKR